MVVEKRILGRSRTCHSEEPHGSESGTFHRREAGKRVQGVEATGKEGTATSGLDSDSTGNF